MTTEQMATLSKLKNGLIDLAERVRSSQSELNGNTVAKEIDAHAEKLGQLIAAQIAAQDNLPAG